MRNSSNETELVTDADDTGEYVSCDFPTITLLQQCIRAASVLLVLLLSLAGNTFVLYVVKTNKTLHTVTHYLIVNMAVADLMITVVNMSELFKMQVTGSDEVFGGAAGHVYCVGMIVVQNLSVSSSILTLTAIAIERFCSIIYPFKRIITVPLAKVMLMGIWLMSFSITIPFFFHIKVEDFYGDGEFYCVEDWSPLDDVTASQVYQVVFFILMYACPLIIIFVLYLSVGVKLWRRQASHESSLGNARRRWRMTVQVTKMLVVTVVAFALCWLPQHVALFINYFVLHACPPEFLWFGGTLLAYANSAMSPAIYVMFHAEYRKQLKNLLLRCCPCCVGCCGSRTRLNLHPKRNDGKSEQFDMVNAVSLRMKTTDEPMSASSRIYPSSPGELSVRHLSFANREKNENNAI